MQAVFLVTIPFFALVLAGFWAAWRGILPLNAIAGLNAYVLFFALPCLLFRFGASTPIATLLDPVTMVVYACCALVVVGFTLMLTLGGRVGWSDASLGALVAAFPNTGFMGVPLLVALFGPGAAGVVIQTIMIDMLLTTSICVALSRWGQGQDASVGQSALNALKGVFSNPMPWAILAGILAASVQTTGVAAWLLPYEAIIAPAYKAMSLLADSASPVALFTIGAVLARAQRQAQTTALAPTGGATPGTTTQGMNLGKRLWGQALVVALIKLFLHPFLVLVAAMVAKALGFALNPFALMVLIAAAALPSASNVSLLAERYGADNGRIARIILLSTVIAFFTFSGLVAALK
jgi:malonate transporter